MQLALEVTGVQGRKWILGMFRKTDSASGTLQRSPRHVEIQVPMCFFGSLCMHSCSDGFVCTQNMEEV